MIPPQSNVSEPWPVDWWLYKERHLVECFFQKLKWFRRIATRYDKLDASFLALCERPFAFHFDWVYIVLMTR